MKKFSIFLVMLFALLLLPFVSGADITPTISTGSEQTFTGSPTITITLADQGNATNVTLWYRGATTGEWTPVNSNRTANLTTYSLRFVSTGQTDSLTAQLNATASNYTMTADSYIGSAIIDVNVDNTAPRIEFRLTKTIIEPLGFTPYTCKITSSEISTNTTFVTELDKTGGSTVTKTSSAEINNVFRGSGSGTYTARCIVTDGQGQGVSSSNISIRTSSDIPLVGYGKQQQIQIKTQQKAQKSNSILWFLIGIVIIAVIVIFVWVISKGSSGKKKRRR